jgi:hypothetical protein
MSRNSSKGNAKSMARRTIKYGDAVLVYDEAGCGKLDAKWTGGYVILKKGQGLMGSSEIRQESYFKQDAYQKA